MSKYNKVTLKQRISDFINRVAPFDGNALIQKSEDNGIRDDVVDSMIAEIPTQANINNPAASFAVDFVTAEEHLIDSTASVPTAFSITLSNLSGNEVGKLAITKKSGDVFSFSNGQILPTGNTEGQTGRTTLNFLVFIINGAYRVELVDNYPLEEWVQVGDITTVDYTTDASNAFVRRTRFGIVEMKGTIEVTRINAVSLLSLATLDSDYRPSVTRGSNSFFDNGVGLDSRETTVSTSGNLTTVSASGTNTYYVDNLTFAV